MRRAPCSTTAPRSSSLLETRRSAKPRELVGPGPTRGRAGAHPRPSPRARPTMASCTPWRFVTVADDQRDAFEALLLDRRWSKHDPVRHRRASPEGSTSSPIMPGQLVVLRLGRRSQDHKIPVWEQELSCGAAGMNLLLAAHALGLCRRLGDRLARLFGAGARRVLRAGRADRRLHLHRPSPAASSRNGRAPRACRRVREAWQPPAS